eukprot:492137-Pelagomonas_calceolata.AAC.4
MSMTSVGKPKSMLDTLEGTAFIIEEGTCAVLEKVLLHFERMKGLELAGQGLPDSRVVGPLAPSCLSQAALVGSYIDLHAAAVPSPTVAHALCLHST